MLWRSGRRGPRGGWRGSRPRSAWRTRRECGWPRRAARLGAGGSPPLLRAVGRLVLAVIAGEGVVADAVTAGGFVVLGGDDAQVVDPGRWRRPGGILRLGLGVGGPADLLRPCQAPGPAVPADLHDGPVERGEHSLAPAARQRRVRLVR